MKYTSAVHEVVDTVPAVIQFAVFIPPLDGDYEKCLRRAYRVYTFIACIVCMIGAVLWIAVGATVAIPPSDSKWIPSCIYVPYPLFLPRNP